PVRSEKAIPVAIRPNTPAWDITMPICVPPLLIRNITTSTTRRNASTTSQARWTASRSRTVSDDAAGASAAEPSVCRWGWKTEPERGAGGGPKPKSEAGRGRGSGALYRGVGGVAFTVIPSREFDTTGCGREPDPIEADFRPGVNRLVRKVTVVRRTLIRLQSSTKNAALPMWDNAAFFCVFL